MPSKSPAQARLMAAAAHTPGGYGGVPQSVGRDFNQADKGSKLLSRANSGRHRGKVSNSSRVSDKLVTGHSALDRARRGGS